MQQNITEEEFEKAFGNINVSMMAFVALSILPIGSECSTRYGTIRRTDEIHFEVIPTKEIKLEDVNSEFTSTKKKASDQLLDLFK